MATRRKSPRVRTREFKVGDRVRFMFGTRRRTGVIVEDRGPLGIDGRRLYAVRARLDLKYEAVLELPAEDLHAA